ncbi:MAG: hypothetical protein RI897_4045 [Verrucomicrobiota bacterium]
MLQVESTTEPDGSQKFYDYHQSGQLARTYGSGVYPVGYGYDLQGRMTSMTNWTTFDPLGEGTGERVTTWEYSPTRGALIKKQFAGESDTTDDYEYTLAGRLHKRIWERGVTTTYAYTEAGDLEQVDYSDTTPDVEYTYDRQGRPELIECAGIQTTLAYNDANQVLSESYSQGILSGLVVSRAFDSYLRLQSLGLNTSSALSTTFGYGDDGRLQTVTSGGNTAQYQYLEKSRLIREIAFAQGTDAMTTTRTYDFLDRLSVIASLSSASTESDRTFPHIGVGGISAGWPDWRRVL